MSGTTIERIVGTNGNDSTKSTSANESFDLKRGFDLITVDITGGEKFGDDVINLTKGENLTVLVKIPADFHYEQHYPYPDNLFTISAEGNDLRVHFNYIKSASEVDDYGTLTFKNFVSSDVVGQNGYVNILLKEYDGSGATGKYWNYNLNEGTVSYYQGVAKRFMDTTVLSFGKSDISKSNVLNGSRLNDDINLNFADQGVTIKAGTGNDTINGSKYNDIIYSGVGNNNINAYAGDDIIYLSKGKNTVTFGDYSIIEHKECSNFDTVYGCDKDDILKFLDVDKNDKNSYRFAKEGNNLVIDHEHVKEGTSDIYNSSVTLSNYFKQKEGTTIDKIYDENDNEIAIKDVYVEGKGTINGTYFDDIIIGSDAIPVRRADSNEIEYAGKIYEKSNIEYNKGDTLLDTQFVYKNHVYNYDDYIDVVVKKAWSGNDIIKGGKGNDTIYGGTGNDKLYGGVGNNEYVFRAGDGKDTVYVTKGDLTHDTLLFKDANGNDYSGGLESHLSYEIKGNDVLITVKDGENINNTVIVKDYMKGGYNVNILQNSSEPISLLAKLNAILSEKDFSNYPKGVKYKGTILDEKITGTNFSDKIYAVSGTNTITAGAGDDKIYAGKGSDNFVFDGKSDSTGTLDDGDNAIFGANKDDKLTFTNQTEGGLAFTKDGNHLVIEYNDHIVGQRTVNGYTITDSDTNSVGLADFFKQSSDDRLDIVFVKGESDSVEKTLTGLINKQTLKIEGKGTIKGTEYNDNIIGSKKADKIYTGVGDDKIYAGKGKDTIYVNGSGKKQMTIHYDDGNDVINMSGKADLEFTFDKASEENDITHVHTEYERKGNDLYIYKDYSFGKPMKEQTITIKNYFKYEGSTLKVDGDEVTNADITTEIIGSTKNDTYDFITDQQTADIEVYDPKGNDTYNVKFTNDTNIDIIDRSGNDTLNITEVEKSNLYLLFNVDRKGNIVVDTEDDGYMSDALSIQGKSGGSIEIGGYFKANSKSNPLAVAGAGRIETINVDGAEWNISETINKVAQDVAAWLLDKPDYVDAKEVLYSGDSDNINALMAIYQNATSDSSVPPSGI